jgi:hypothetical protein
VDEADNVFGGATLRLYRDDGDGVFSPFAETPEPEPEAEAESPGAGPAPSSEVQAIAYGETVEGALTGGAPALWAFTGAAAIRCLSTLSRVMRSWWVTMTAGMA